MSFTAVRTSTESSMAVGTAAPPTLSQLHNIRPCAHLAQVLNSNARDTVLRNYTLAVRVAHFTSTPSHSLPTLKATKGSSKGQKLDKQRMMRLKSRALRCKDCHEGLDSTFMCLQCPHVGCWHKGHFISHAKLQGHIFGIDGQTGLLFCFKCGDYTNDGLLEVARSKVMNRDEVKEEMADDAELIAKYSTTTNYKPTTGLRGFVNMGSTCFMSSVLQTFIHNPVIREYFMTEGHMDCDKRKDECITCCVDDIFTEFYTSNKTSGFGPVSLLSAAWKTNKSLAGYSEQDAHEFWQFMVNQLHMGLTHTVSTPQGHPSCSCVLHKTFSSDLQSSITCTECGNVTNTVDPIIDISLEITQSDDLMSCFRNFTKLEKLDIKYNCASCGDRTQATKRLSIKKFPQTLAIQLKRFEHNSQSVKLEKFINFPLFINLSEFSTEYTQNRQVDPALNYELFAIVCHIGSVNTGHYVVVVKNHQGQWFKFDDSVVTLLPVEQVLQLKAYLLFYIVHKF